MTYDLHRAPPPSCPRWVWVFDQNRRVYREGQSAPVWREHWRRLPITGETSRSWLVGRFGDVKIPKSRERQPHWVAWSEHEIERQAWAQEQRHRIAQAIYSQVQTPLDRLEEIAELIDWEVPPLSRTPDET